MLTRNRSIFLSLTISLAVSVSAIGVATAGNWSFLSNTPMAKFTKEDLGLMVQTAEAVVTDAKTPAIRRWKNAATGNSGELKTLLAFTGPRGEPCKRLHIVNRAGKQEGKATYTVCDMPPDSWRLVPSDFAPVPKRPVSQSSTDPRT